MSSTLETTPAVNPEKVLRDLRDLWAQLSREQENAGGVLRACAMTLIVLADGEQDAEDVRRTLGVLMHNHPSRAIVVRATEGAALNARVFAECWMPFGRNQQICSEGIEMSADAANLDELARVMIPLLVPDLPVVLWCRGPRFFSTRYFDPLFPLAHKIVADSSVAPNPKGAIAVLKEMRSRGRRLADLSWTQLTAWRETLAHEFEDCPKKRSKVREVHIQYGGALSTAILYFARWIERVIPAARISFEAVTSGSGLSMARLTGDELDLVLTAAGGSIEVRDGCKAAKSILPQRDVDSLMNEELSILDADPVFESVLME